MAKPSIVKGTRDFLPSEVVKRNYIFDVIKTVFTKYGFLPIETPSMELLTTLTGKYGEEGDKLLFKILNNGEYLDKADKEALAQEDYRKLTPTLARRGLRYDLTVPFARFVTMHQHKIALPFKRYQIQPVWRADRPQKGRYREFYQCDVDVVGSESLMYEAELASIYSEVFAKLGISVKIMINNRKILFGIAECCAITDQFIDMTVAIDKLDKVGLEGVMNELTQRGISNEAQQKIKDFLSVTKLDELDSLMTGSEQGQLGVQEVRSVLQYLDDQKIKDVHFDITLARGLSYYTGCIFEVAVDTNVHSNIKMGSIGGGGRYDNLTESFGLKGVSGVGVSFGAERIYDVMQELDIFPSSIGNPVKLFLTSFDEASHRYAYQVACALRAQDIPVDLYPEPAKMKKQLKYASDRGFELVGICGDNEIKDQSVTVKNLSTGEQSTYDIEALVTLLCK